MAFVDESGKAIIKSATGIDKPEVKPTTVKLMEDIYSKTTGTEVKIERDGISSTPIEKRVDKRTPKPTEVKVMEDVYSDLTGADVTIEPSGTTIEPRTISSFDIRKQRFEEVKDVLRAGQDIDPSARYELESGEVVSGRDLRQRYGNVAALTWMSGRQVPAGEYVISPEGQYYKIPEFSAELKYIIEHGEPFERAMFYKSLYDSEKAAAALEKLYKSLEPEEMIDYTIKFAKFGDTGDTYWEDIKTAEPAAFLEVKDGEVKVKIDTARWYKEKYSVWEKLHPYETLTREFSFGVGRFADPGHWGALFKGDLKQYRADVEYKWFKEMGIGTANQDLYKWYTGEGLLQSPAYMNIVYPFAMGGAAGALFRGVSGAATAATGLKAAILTKVAARGPLVIAGAAGTIAGTDITLTGIEEYKGKLPEGSTIHKAATYAMQFGAAGMGAKTVTSWEPTLAVGRSGQFTYFQKYLTTLRGKPILPFGKRIVMTETGGGVVTWPSIINVGKIKFEAFDLLKTQLGSGATTPPPPYQPDLGYPLASSKPFSIYSTKPTGGKPLPVSEWAGRFYIETGEGWQPKTTFTSPYTPIVRPPSALMPRWYSEIGKQFIVDYTPYIKDFFAKKFGFKLFKEPVIKMKDPVIKDMGKMFQAQEKAFDKIGGTTQTQKGGTKTVQLEKLDTKTEYELKSLSESVSDLVGEEQLSFRHPLYDQTGLLALEKDISLRHPLYGTAFAMGSKQKRALDTVSVLDFDQMQSQMSALIPKQAKISIEDVARISMFDAAVIGVGSYGFSDYEWPKYKYDKKITAPPVLFDLPVVPKTPKGVMSFPLIPEGTSKKGDPMKAFSLSLLGYREREFKFMKLEEIFRRKF